MEEIYDSTRAKRKSGRNTFHCSLEISRIFPTQPLRFEKLNNVNGYLANKLQQPAEFLSWKDEVGNPQSLGKGHMKPHLHRVSLLEIQH